MVTSGLMFAQEMENNLSGNLTLDSYIVFEQTNPTDDSGNITPQRKSPLLAGLYSFVLPGAGQFYNDEIWKSAIFLAAEAAAITVGVIYDGKGDDQTVFFENYAKENWSAERYANWTLYHASELNHNLTEEQLVNFQNGMYDENDVLQWNVLNQLESAIGGYYSHRLAPYGDQQYFEMIGKYSQFNVGWEEFGDDPAKEYDYTPADPKLTEQFKYYSGERGKANDYYSYAKTAVIVVVVNHILSAIEAAWTSNSINRSLDVKVSLENQRYGFVQSIVPKLNISLNF
ncbi:MAG: DUF5683 domain-containing protein [bacterium]